MPSDFIDLERCLRLPLIEPYAGFDISADGNQAAFAWNLRGQWEVYLLDLQKQAKPAQITSGPGAKLGPRFTPDGLGLWYLLDEDGSEEYDIWFQDLQSGMKRNLTPDTPEAIQPNFDRSSDGRWIAYQSNRSGRFSTYLLSTDAHPDQVSAGEPEPVFTEGGPHWDVRFSPEGSWLAVVGESSGQDHTTTLINISKGKKAGEAQQIELQGKPLNALQVCWSPDGSRLAFSSDVAGWFNIGIYALRGGEIVWMTSGEGDKSEPDWSPDGKRLAYIYSLGAETWLAVHELRETHPSLYQVEPGVHYKPKFTPDGRKILLAFDNPRRPTDLWLFDLEQKAFRQLTQSLSADLSSDDFIVPRQIQYPSLDGCSVPALLYMPKSNKDCREVKKPPAVIVIHGGPNWYFQLLWYPLMAHMVSRGWVVLAPNYRGSTGYGREWQLSNRFELGRGDTMDIVAGADYLVREGLADAGRIGVTGRSHGGYLTMSCLTDYPDRWKAGSAVVPFLNWFTSHANSREDLRHWDIENMGDPVENAELWRERSPFFKLDRITAPVQLICGANDPRCPASESIAARDKLMELGKQVDFLLYPDEGHTFLKIENIVDHELRRVEFLARALESK